MTVEAITTQTTISGLTRLQELGLAGIFLSFILLGGVVALWYFARHCEERTERARMAYEEEAKQSRGVIEKNTEAFHGVQLALVRLEGKIER